MNDNIDNLRNKNDILKQNKAIDKHKKSGVDYCSKIIYDYDENSPIDTFYNWKSIEFWPPKVLTTDWLVTKSFEEEHFIDPQKEQDSRFGDILQFSNFLSKEVIDKTRFHLINFHKNQRLNSSNLINNQNKELNLLKRKRNDYVKNYNFLIDSTDNYWFDEQIRRKYYNRGGKHKQISNQYKSKPVCNTINFEIKKQILKEQMNGYQSKYISSKHKINHNTIRTIIHKFRHGKYNKKQKPQKQLFSKITNQQLYDLEKILTEYSDQKILNIYQIQTIIRNKFDLDLKAHYISTILRFLNFKQKQYSTSEKFVDKSNAEICMKHIQNFVRLAELIDMKAKFYSCDESFLILGESNKKTQAKSNYTPTLYKPKHATKFNWAIFLSQSKINSFQISMKGYDRWKFETQMKSNINMVRNDLSVGPKVILIDGHSIHKNGRFQSQINGLCGFRVFLFTPQNSFLNPCEYGFNVVKRHQREQDNYGEVLATNSIAKSIKAMSKEETDFCWIYASNLWLNQYEELIVFFNKNQRVVDVHQ